MAAREGAEPIASPWHQRDRRAARGSARPSRPLAPIPRDGQPAGVDVSPSETEAASMVSTRRQQACMLPCVNRSSFWVSVLAVRVCRPCFRCCCWAVHQGTPECGRPTSYLGHFRGSWCPLMQRMGVAVPIAAPSSIAFASRTRRPAMRTSKGTASTATGLSFQ